MGDMDSRPGPVALVGSGEYLPVMEDIERRLIAGRPPRFVQLATAAAPEGPGSLGRWHALGRASAERLGVTQVVVPVVDRFREAVPGLGAVPQLSVLPHFDRFAGRLPDLVLTRVSNPPPGVTSVGVDEDTALVGGWRDDPDEWEVVGRQSVWVLTPDGREEHPAGSVLCLGPVG